MMKFVRILAFSPNVGIFLSVISTKQASGRRLHTPRELSDSIFDNYTTYYVSDPFNGNPPVATETDGQDAWGDFMLENPDSLELLDRLGVINPSPWAGTVVAECSGNIYASGCGRKLMDNSYNDHTFEGAGEPGKTETTRYPETTPTVTTTTTTTTTTVKKCGPDITDWLVKEMNTNKNHHVIKTNRDNDWAMWIPFFNIGWHAGFLFDFKDLVKAGAVWDYKATQDFSSANCPRNCPKTVTLCGICFFYDVPGNIHYGWVGRAGRIRAWFLHDQAAAAQAGGVDDPLDTAAIDIGINLWDNGGGNICVPIAAAAAKKKLATRDCPTCGDKFPLAGKPKR